MDIQSYTQRARSVIQNAQSEAVTRDHQQLTSLHVMAGLAAENGGLPVKLLQMAGADTATLENLLETALVKLPKVEGGSGLSLSTAAAKTFANAEKAAKKAGDAFVTTERLLLAAVLNADKDLKTLLSQIGLDETRLTEAIKSVRTEGPVTSDAAEDQYEALSKYARDLTEAARAGKLDPVIGRDRCSRAGLRIIPFSLANPVLVKRPLQKALLTVLSRVMSQNL